jgi:diguanylate cyclase (GGDEF)-like protein/PAS domain S-box-containing protein
MQTTRNVEHLRQARLRIREQASQLAEASGIATYSATARGRLLSCSPALLSLLGYPDFKSLQASHPAGLPQLYVEPQRYLQLLQRLHQEPGVQTWRNQWRRADGSLAWVRESLSALRGRDGRILGLHALVLDLSGQLAAEDELLRSAFHDSQTGLPNRALLLERLGQALKACLREPGRRVGLCFVSLDQLGSVNESVGHRAGDRLLTAAAERLGAGLRPGDTLARIGGNSFALLLDDCGGEEGARSALQRLRQRLSEPLSIGGQELEPTACLGLACGGAESAGPEDLLREAESALQQAREQGRDHLVVYDGRRHAAAAERLAIEHGLRRAVERDEIWVAYQPVVSLGDGQLRGFEALARWQHPRLGSVRPDRFIPVAEASGQIEALGARVLELACARAEAWAAEREAGEPFFVSVNLSPRQLLAPNLVSLVGEAMARHRLGPGALKLEITESLLVQEPERSRQTMEALADLGASLWLDDFGTGYSSLGTLAQFPIHGIKLDRSFVRDLEGSLKARAVLEGTLALARRLRLSVVAEGIETEAQARLLRATGCGLGQGYLYSAPLPEPQARLYLFQGRLGAAPI